MRKVLNVTAAFAAGALAVCLVDRSVRSWQLNLAEDDRAGDAQLREDVRSRLGEWVSHPGAIEVDASEHVVRLTGQVLAQELDGLLSQVKGVRGVRKVRNALTVLSDSEGFNESKARPSAPPQPALPEWTPGI